MVVGVFGVLGDSGVSSRKKSRHAPYDGPCHLPCDVFSATDGGPLPGAAQFYILVVLAWP